MHRTKRESSSALGPIMKAKSVDELISSLLETEDGSEESTEALDELIRRAALYTEMVNLKETKESLEGAIKRALEPKMLAPDPSNKGH